MTYSQIRKLFFTELASFYHQSELTAIWKYCLDFVLKVSGNFLIIHPEIQAEEEKSVKMSEVISRLKKQEPIQYIVGKTWFCNNEFFVDPSVLIPRPETEELVYKVCQNIEDKPTVILDIGTGSGCIAISIKKLKPLTHIVAVDISANALDIAQKNAFNILGENAISFIRSDVLKQEFTGDLNLEFDIIISNPPYIPFDRDAIHGVSAVPANVTNFEPHLALFCGDDPLLFYKAISLHAKQLLKPGGLLFFEIHENFATEVSMLLKNENFKEIEIFKDMYNKDRIIKAKI